MYYVMSDLHGCLEEYQRALELLALKEDDTLFILGDVVDRGTSGMKILLDMMTRPQIVPLVGNHDYMAMKGLAGLVMEVTEENLEEFQSPEFQANLKDWLLNGGQPTVDEFRGLSAEEQSEILEYLGEFSLYEEVSVAGRDYVLVHAGIDNFVEQKPLEDYMPFDFLLHRTDYTKIHYKDKFLVTGHTPTRLIHQKGDVIYRKNNHIALDCGCCYGGQLGIFCLDTEEEFYVRKGVVLS